MSNQQKNGKTVRLDNEVMDTLAEKRKGFETPSDCIKRLLTKSCKNSKQETEQQEEDEDE